MSDFVVDVDGYKLARGEVLAVFCPCCGGVELIDGAGQRITLSPEVAGKLSFAIRVAAGKLADEDPDGPPFVVPCRSRP